MKKIIYLFAFVLLLSSCNSSDNETNAENQDSLKNQEAANVTIDLEKLKEKVVNWRGGVFLKEVSAENGNINIVYVKDFSELKSLYPMLTTTEADYKKELGKAFEIDKMLAELPVKTFLKFRDALSVSILIPFEGVNYKLKITKKDIETFAGTTLDEIDKDYTANYGDKYVFDEAGRKKFVAKFVTK
jgi:hypothetical protein